MDDGTGDGADAVKMQNEYFIEQRVRAHREGRELDVEAMVQPISEQQMDAFLNGALNSGVNAG